MKAWEARSAGGPVLRASAALAAAGLLALAGCGGHGSRSASPTPRAGPRVHGDRPPSDADQLLALLARRDGALQAGDPAALAATSTGAQRAHDRRAARHARALSLRDVASRARVGIAGRGATLHVRTAYGLAGADGRFEVAATVRAVRTPAGWRLRAGARLERDRPLWEVAAYRAQRSPHFLVLVPAGHALPGLLHALETGRRRLTRALPGVHPPGRLLVLVAADSAQARELTCGVTGIESLAAISDARVVERGPARRTVAVPSQRLIVLRTAYAALDVAGRRRVITHELTHAALAGNTSGRTPAWLLEGIALYASGDQRAGEAGRLLRGDPLAGVSAAAARGARRVAGLAALARPDAIARVSGAAQAAAYAYASAAAFAIAARYGRGDLLRLYDVFNAEDLTGTPSRALDDRALHRVLGTSLAALEREVRAYALARAAAG